MSIYLVYKGNSNCPFHTVAIVDCVFVGSEAVLENGGIVNRIGTYTIALCAKAYNKPFYVCAESFKFLKRFILD